MHIYKRGSIWWIKTKLADGSYQRESTGCRSREAAELFVKREERRRADPDYAAKEEARFVEESRVFIADVKARKGVPAGTVNMYECKVGHLNRLMPELMADVDAKTVDTYFQTRRSEGADPEGSTLYKEWIALRGVLTSAKRRSHWSGEIDILRPAWVSQSTKPKERRLTWPELRALLIHATPELADLVRYAVATGARRAELMAAREGDANPETNRVLVRGTKTAGAWKEIPIPPVFRELLPKRAWGPVAGKAALMFSDCPENLRCLNGACTSAKIEPVSYNDLRRTFASLLLDGGMTNTVAAQLMRHKGTAMVDKFYGKMDSDALAELVERQAPLTPPPSPPAAPPPEAAPAPVDDPSAEPEENAALAVAIAVMTKAGEWEVVAGLAKELEARRARARERAGVVDLAAERRKRGPRPKPRR